MEKQTDKKRKKKKKTPTPKFEYLIEWGLIVLIAFHRL